MADFEFDIRDIERIADELERFAEHALPYAARQVLNKAAFDGRKVWQKAMAREFTLRNKYVARSVRVEKATHSRRIESMESVLGSVFPGLEKQEKGGRVRPRSGAHKPIPTRVAAGQSMGAGERTKTVRRPNKLAAIQLTRRPRGGSRKQRNAIAIAQAVRKRQQFALIETARGDAIVKVTGRKRLRVRMLWDLSRSSVNVPASPTLQRTLKIMERRMPQMAVDALVEQAKRNKVLGFR